MNKKQRNQHSPTPALPWLIVLFFCGTLAPTAVAQQEISTIDGQIVDFGNKPVLELMEVRAEGLANPTTSAEGTFVLRLRNPVRPGDSITITLIERNWGAPIVQTVALNPNYLDPSVANVVIRLSKKVHIEQFKSDVDIKTEKLGNLIAFVADKGNPNLAAKEEKMQAIFGFFLQGENQTVEVSNTNTGLVVKREMGEYLRNLTNLPYTQITFKWEVMEVVNITEDADGNFWAEVEVKQYFIGEDGSISDTPAYSDVTKKIIQVKQEYIQTQTGDQVRYIPQYLFGNIQVVETRRY